MDELRRTGLEKMNEVYGWEMPNIEGDPYFDLTVDHLFGRIWTRPELSMRDKRIMTLTAVTAIGKAVEMPRPIMPKATAPIQKLLATDSSKAPQRAMDTKRRPSATMPRRWRRVSPMKRPADNRAAKTA